MLSKLENAPTRIRTRNALLEARSDHPFHHRGVCPIVTSGRQGIRTLIPTSENRLSRAARPTVSGYLPFQWTHRESNPDFQTASLMSSLLTMSPFCSVDRRGVEPRFPGCKPGVFPLDEQPVCFLSKSPSLPSTLASIQVSCRWTSRPLLSLQYLSPCARHTPVCRARLRVRPGFEPGLPPYRGGVPPKTPTDQSDPGWS